ncbi:hypothetical protein MBANPS3_010420 [Mucor bainieri]
MRYTWNADRKLAMLKKIIKYVGLMPSEDVWRSAGEDFGFIFVMIPEVDALWEAFHWFDNALEEHQEYEREIRQFGYPLIGPDAVFMNWVREKEDRYIDYQFAVAASEDISDEENLLLEN